jgi:hypothetical protein
MRVIIMILVLLPLLITPSIANNNCDNPPNRGECSKRGR